MVMDIIDLNGKGFWKELGIKPSNDLDANIENFYSKYSKEINLAIPSASKDKSKIISILKNKSLKEKSFFLDIFLKHLERKIKDPQFSEIKLDDFNIESLKSYSLRLIRRLRKIDRTIKDLYVKPDFYPTPFFDKESNRIWFTIKKKYSGEAVKYTTS
ncbi:hypothetical protein J4429_01030 [Candidatus Pacearchaeota archaeon]|nr:hypothetical protein [Candidatus Pacearchaeota archaeon]